MIPRHTSETTLLTELLLLNEEEITGITVTHLLIEETDTETTIIGNEVHPVLHINVFVGILDTNGT
jgi:hypothetical protein